MKRIVLVALLAVFFLGSVQIWAGDPGPDPKDLEGKAWTAGWTVPQGGLTQARLEIVAVKGSDLEGRYIASNRESNVDMKFTSPVKLSNDDLQMFEFTSTVSGAQNVCKVQPDGTLIMERSLGNSFSSQRFNPAK